MAPEATGVTDVEIFIYVPAIPVAQPRPRATVVAGHARVYGADRKHPIHDFKATVRLAAQREFQGPPVDCPISVNLLFILPRPGRLRWKTKSMPRQWHKSKPDVDNLQKSVLDALTGIVWARDEQVACLKVEKLYAAGDEAPHVEIAIRPASAHRSESLEEQPLLESAKCWT